MLELKGKLRFPFSTDKFVVFGMAMLIERKQFKIKKKHSENTGIEYVINKSMK